MRGILALTVCVLCLCSIIVPVGYAGWGEQLTISGQVRTGEWRPKYLILLDGKQVASYGSQAGAEKALHDAVNSGQAMKGEVQRSTDQVILLEYSLPVTVPVPAMPPQQPASEEIKTPPPAAPEMPPQQPASSGSATTPLPSPSITPP